MANVINLKDVQELDPVLDKNSGLAVVHFWMPWSQPSVQMSEVLDEIAKEHDQVKFVKVEAENFPNICMKYDIAAVPTTIFIRSGKVLDRVDGAHAPELSKKTTKYASVTVVPPLPPPPKEDLNTRLKKLVNSAPCLLFMKGTPEEPRCGFSRQMVGLLKEANIQFSTFDILCDDEVRQGLKTFSNWPTYPQLYANGELLGGLDIVKELIVSNELQSMLPVQKTITERLKELVNRASVMLFMKGNPQEPRCGFSRQMVAILDEAGINYDTFDILTDEEVRQNLKTFSNWPSYPQLYVKGDLIGGLDIVKELKENGELQESLSTES